LPPRRSRGRPQSLAHVLDFLGDVLDVQFREACRTQQRRLLSGPGDDVGVIEVRLLGDRRLRHVGHE
jgi:hypothetical protein